MRTAPPGSSGRVRAILAILFLTTFMPPVAGQVVVRLGNYSDDLDVVDVYEDGFVWIVTAEGLYYLTETGKLEERVAEGERKGANRNRVFNCITRVGERILLGAEDGLFEITDNGYRHVAMAPIDRDTVKLILAVKKNQAGSGGREREDLFVATDTTIYRRQGEEGALEPVLSSSYIFLLKVVNGQVYAASHEGVHSFDGRKFEPLDGEPVRFVVDIISVDDRLYFVEQPFSRDPDRGCGFHLHERLNDVTELVVKCIGAAEIIDGSLWYARGASIFQIKNGMKGSVGFDKELGDIKAIYESGGSQYVVTPGAIVRRKRQQRPAPFTVFALMVDRSYLLESLRETGKGVVLFGSGGAYIVVEDVDIDVELNGWFGVLGGEVKVDGVRYVGVDGDPFRGDGDVFRRFRIYLESDQAAFDAGKEDSHNYDRQGAARLNPGRPKSTIYIGVQDSYGSLHEPDPQTIWVISGFFWWVLLPLLLFPWIAIVLFGWFWPAEVRLWAFFGIRFLSRVIPLYGAFVADFALSPSRRLVRWWLRSVVRDGWSCGGQESSPSRGSVRWLLRRVVRRGRGRRKSKTDVQVKIERWLMERSNRTVDLSGSDLAALDIDTVEREVACSRSGLLGKAFPVSMEIGDIAVDRANDEIERETVRRLDEILVHAEEVFCERLARKALVVFLFPYDVEKREHVLRISERLTRRVRSAYVVLVPREGVSFSDSAIQ